jgi:hypothetical protein
MRGGGKAAQFLTINSATYPDRCANARLRREFDGFVEQSHG